MPRFYVKFNIGFWNPNSITEEIIDSEFKTTLLVDKWIFGDFDL